jgi:hypothetical protein
MVPLAWVNERNSVVDLSKWRELRGDSAHDIGELLIDLVAELLYSLRGGSRSWWIRGRSDHPMDAVINILPPL